MGHKSKLAQQAWQHCYEAGNAFLQQGNLRNAAIAFSDALEACTDTVVRANIFYARAFVYWTASHFATAIDDLSKAIELNDKMADAYNLRGVCHARTKDMEAAIADFSKAIDLGLNDASPFLNRAKTFLELGQLEFALPDLLDAISRDEQHSSWLDKLVKELGNELQLNRAATTYANRALALHYASKTEESIQDMALAMSLAQTGQEQAFVLIRLAQIRIYEGDFLGAINDCSKAVQFDPECTLAFYLAGLAYVELGHLEEAQTTFVHCQTVAGQQQFAGADHIMRVCQSELADLALPAPTTTAVA
jgi:tetratricopeptide (TPR) repeat protein